MDHRRELAGAKTYGSDRRPWFTRRMLARRREWHPATVACDNIAGFSGERSQLYLNPLKGRIHGANGSAGSGLFRENIPGFEGVTQFEFDAVYGDRPDLRKAELQLRREPLLIEVVARSAQPGEHIAKVAPDKMRQHKAVMKGSAPTDQAPFEWTFPKHAYQRADKQHLDKTHSDMRSHFKGP